MNEKLTYLITGATSGIGTFLARHLAATGATLILHGRDEGKLHGLRKVLGDGNLTTVLADLSDFSQIERMFKQIKKQHPAFNVLVNNAFGKLEDSLVDADPESISEHVQTTISGTAQVIKLSVPMLQQSRPSFIINIVADWGLPMHNIMTGPSIYVATKYAIHGLGTALQMELGEYGIRTTNICPGIVAANTPFGESDESFSKKNADGAIHPATVANAIDFVVGQKFAHIRTIVISPPKPDYNGL